MMYSFELTTPCNQVNCILTLPLIQPNFLGKPIHSLVDKNIEMTRKWEIKEEAMKSLLSKPYPDIGPTEVLKKQKYFLHD